MQQRRDHPDLLLHLHAHPRLAGLGRMGVKETTKGARKRWVATGVRHVRRKHREIFGCGGWMQDDIRFGSGYGEEILGGRSEIHKRSVDHSCRHGSWAPGLPISDSSGRRSSAYLLLLDCSSSSLLSVDLRMSS